MSIETAPTSAIPELIEQKMTPMLPFEYKMLGDRLSQLGVDQREMAQLLGEAMRQSSETDHDNAPAEVIAQMSRGRATEANDIMRQMRTAVLMEKPEHTTGATIGSLIDLRFSDEDEVTPVLLTGISRRGTDDIMAALPDDTEFVTVRSPLGEAVLHTREGDQFAYAVNNRKLGGVILALNHIEVVYSVPADMPVFGSDSADRYTRLHSAILGNTA